MEIGIKFKTSIEMLEERHSIIVSESGFDKNK